MPKYRFTATDRSGLIKSGVINADDPHEAREMLRERGFHVRELIDISSPSNDPAPLDLDDTPPPRPRSSARSSEQARPSRGGQFTFVLALFAFLLTLATAGYVVYRDPPWGRLSKYDFGTPEAAQKSLLKMQHNGDFQAMIELEKKIDRRKTQERLDTLTVKKTVEYQGKKGLFTSVRVEGKTRKSVEWFEKDADSGYWKQAYVSAFEVEKTDKPLAEEIKKWEAESDRGDEAKW